jgi:hypothetical protein
MTNLLCVEFALNKKENDIWLNNYNDARKENHRDGKGKMSFEVDGDAARWR